MPQLDAEARRAAQLMISLGLRREDRVVMIMLDTVDFPAVFLGAMLAGIVPIPLNTALSNDTYKYMLGGLAREGAVRQRAAAGQSSARAGGSA